MSKKISGIFVLAVILTASAFGDDGSWNQSFSIQGGSIYSETNHPDILLDKELLVFDGEKTTAVFLFKNTSNRNITVDCGFPVRHLIETVDYGTHLEIPSSPYGGKAIPALAYFETIELFDPEELDEPAYSLPVGILLNDENNRREFIDPSLAASEVEFSITQDGNPMSTEQVLLERLASRIGASVTYHFKHTLSFKPGAASTVVVEYRQDLLAGSDGMSDAFRWDYVIGTGATWKGSIGSFLLLIPAGWNGELPGLKTLGEYQGFSVYGAENYEPDRIDTFSLRSWGLDFMTRYVYREDTFPVVKKIWQTGSAEVMQPTAPAQSFVRNVSASSFLKDQVTVFHAEGVVDAAGFGPLSAFDGLGETSWCEGDAGDGIGESIQCTLTSPVWAVRLKNGFTRFPAKDWMFETGDFEDYIRDDKLGLRDYYTMNSRVKVLKVSPAGGETRYTLILSDRRDEQVFCGLFLEPGDWTFTIDAVYPGSRWKDTCLAEMAFITYSEAGQVKPYLEDPFYRKHLTGIRF
ncbi:MAG: hypothetical protein JW760_03840 [Spirochaetales bacterium]|nr:hypothetical protein [Spirochaetales bacterium]